MPSYDQNNTRVFYNALANPSQVAQSYQILPGMPAPLFELSEEAITVGGNVWGTKRNIVLRGQINMNDQYEFYNIQRYLLTVFAQNFGSLLIYDNFGLPSQVTTLELDNIYCESIEFPDSRYLGIGEYVITLSCYPPDFFQQYGVTDVKDEWSFKENGDYLLEIVHTFGAKGFNTNLSAGSYNNAFSNAQTFVLNSSIYESNNPYTFNGLIPPNQMAANPPYITIVPQFIRNKNATLGYVPYLYSSVETINTAAAEYTVTQTFKADLFHNQFGILRYKIQMDIPFADFRVVTIDGEYKGDYNAPFSTLLSNFMATDFLGQAMNFEPLINPATFEKTINENQLSKSIKFSFKWNTDKSPNIIQDINTKVDANIDMVTCSIGGEIRAKKQSGPAWSGDSINVLSVFSGLDLYGMASVEYLNYFSSGVTAPLSQIPRSKSVSQNVLGNILSFNYVYDNNTCLNNNFEVITIKKDVSIPTKIIKANLLLNQTYSFVDVGIDSSKRIKLSANGVAIENVSPSNAQYILSGVTNSYYDNGGQLVSVNQSYNNQSQYNFSTDFIYPVQAGGVSSYTGINL